MKTRKQKSQFSLVEIIVVIAIVMTLFSIMVSAIKTSNDLSKKVVCMSNIAQIRTYTELYRKDNNKLPYSDIWLTDFSYAATYMGGKDGLGVFTCPGSKDENLTSVDQLTQYTSYYYVPSRDVLSANLADGQKYGFNLLNISSLSEKDQLVIYDKSPDHHNGKINIAYLYDEYLSKHKNEGQIVSLGNTNSVLSLDGSGQAELTDSNSYGIININPANSTNNIFTLTNREGDVMVLRDDQAGMGTATQVTIRVKGNNRTMVIDGQEYNFRANQTYTITATNGGNPSITNPFFLYDLTQDGNGMGQWYIEIIKGLGSITVTEGGSTTEGNGSGTNSNGNGGGTTTTSTNGNGNSGGGTTTTSTGGGTTTTGGGGATTSGNGNGNKKK